MPEQRRARSLDELIFSEQAGPRDLSGADWEDYMARLDRWAKDGIPSHPNTSAGLSDAREDLQSRHGRSMAYYSLLGRPITDVIPTL